MRWYPVGYDFGNSETNLTILKGKEILKNAAPTAFVAINKNAMKNLGVEISTGEAFAHQFEDESHTIAFGHLALMQGVPTESRRGDDLRYASKYSVRGLLSLSASLLAEKEYGLYVVTGLPADLFTKSPGLRKQIKEGLEGTYTFSIDAGKTWRTAHIQIATVVMEGAGALLAFGGQIGKATESGVVDIGGATTDLYAQRGQIPMADFCKGKRIAVETATQMLKDAFEASFGPRTLTDLEARECMFAYAAAKNAKRKKAIPQYPNIAVYGKMVEAKELEFMVKQAVEHVADEIASFVSSAWRQAGASRFNPVLLIGGGSYYFGDALRERIPHLKVPEDPTFANALGYASLAQRLLQMRNAEARREAQRIEPTQQGESEAPALGQ